MSGLLINPFRFSGGGAVPTEVTLLAMEVRNISTAYSINTTPSFVPWANSVHSSGPALINASDNTRFDMPSGAKYCLISARFRQDVFNSSYGVLHLFKNGSDADYTTQLWRQGWHPAQSTAIIPVTAGDYLQFSTRRVGTTLRAIRQGRECWVDVRVYE